ncbi:multidrug effflux MFS transporter [Vibrio hannami]|uniref:multidrug effflux MFS transporter n=1 Tax=Vibrio hannami TaxID=2717094 RepID=UPI00240ED61F|nr:multidrug effflux MFS transporter [Vibrio hannami]MDG3086711.1 multidrug effflux MFS transporter [Vibrio hannami]
MTSTSKLQISMTVLLVLFSPLAIDIYLPAIPIIANSFHVEHALAQDTISWFLFSMGLGQLFAGPLADRYGRKAVAVSGIILYGTSSYLAATSASIEWLLFARLLQGLGACATSVAAFATVRDIFGENKSGQMISYLNGAICFIPALAPILGSYLTQSFGWRSNFTFMALFALVVGFIVITQMKETNKSVSSGPIFSLDRYRSILSSGTFLFHASLCMLAMAVILAYVSAAPIVLMEKFGLSMNEFTYWFGANALINIIAAFTAPKIMQKKGSHFSLISGISLIAVAGLLMLAAVGFEQPLAFMGPVFLSSIGFAMILGSAAGKALAPFGNKAGTAAALLGLIQMSGAGLFVGTSQRLGVEPQQNIALHMIVIAPALLMLFSSKGRNWHKQYS